MPILRRVDLAIIWYYTVRRRKFPVTSILHNAAGQESRVFTTIDG